MLLRVAVTLLIFATSCPVHAAASKKTDSDTVLINSWKKNKKLVEITNTKDRADYYVADTRKVDANGIVSAWVQTLYKAPFRASRPKMSKKIRWDMSKYEFNCSNNSVNVSRRNFYDINGNIVDSVDGLEEWSEYVPGSYGEHFFNLFCADTTSTSNNYEGMKAQEIPEGTGIRGRVVETMNSGGYTYALILLDSDSTTRWIALPEVNISVGDNIEYPDTPPLTNFQSKTLGRTFAKLSFVPGLRIYK